MKPTIRSIVLPIALLVSTTSVYATQYDIVIQGGHVIDPETGLSDVRNIGINKGTIETITMDAIAGKQVIDASDHVVSPGFIDLHHHGQNIAGYRMQAQQGVTTALELESGILPIGEWYRVQSEKNLPINYGASAAWTFARIATFTETEPVANLEYFQSMQGENNWKQEIATPEQLEKIMAYVQQGLDEGAIGIGINAGYAPGYGQKEYYALSKLAAEQDVATYTHVRYASMLEPGSSFEAIQELIANSALTGAKMHINHINSTSLRDIDATLELFDEATANGFHVTAGAYPWGAASTVVGAAMFSGPEWKERLGYQEESIQMGTERLDNTELLQAQKEQPGSIINWHFLDEAIPSELSALDRSIIHPNVLIESDSMPWMLIDDGKVSYYEGDEWPIPSEAFAHPRSSGTFTKILGSYVRDRGLLSMEEAIRKMSYMPATVLDGFVPQMKKKGRIQVGMDADIVIFNPETVDNQATYQVPAAISTGINTVLVNGQFVVQDGELLTDAAPGQPIRRNIN
ncbi:amidohydrolase family protein [Vibrio methylphosphonaticus]|uniref:amidohydrolase family protein n=1 Tax=Vibrio methylphosphonaticus TaxID=2946866 RepID=UPI00202A4305|nr:amidohydrolase family protein [Vibrio methylphosphonaticus]MCL9773764.1 amidohydrolase family protein [Vibrio methylphosphonaticus]